MYTKDQLTTYPYFAEALGRRSVEQVLDPLTGIVSRQYIMGFAQSLIDSGTPFTFGMLDLDNFKFINDTYGHHIGDQVLVSVAGGLADYLEGYGVAGRFGGDELMWINLRDLAYDRKKAFLVSLYDSQRVVRKNVPAQGCAPFITGTVGCATCPDDAQDFSGLFSLIDKTLYRGKSKGRNCYIIYVKEKHAGIDIRHIARQGLCTSMCNVVRMFEMVPGLKNKLHSVTPVLADELRLTDLYYVGQDRIMRAVRAQGVAEDASDIDRLMSDEVFATNDLRSVESRSPAFCTALRRREVETLMVVRVGMDQRTDGYLICAEPHSQRIWQEDECALVFFLAKLIAAQLSLEGGTLKMED